MDIIELLDDILEPCKHCGGSPKKTQLDDVTLETLTTYQCTTCTFETKPCWPELDAKRRWNNGTPYFVILKNGEFQDHITFYRYKDKPTERKTCIHLN